MKFWTEESECQASNGHWLSSDETVGALLNAIAFFASTMVTEFARAAFMWNRLGFHILVKEFV